MRKKITWLLLAGIVICSIIYVTVPKRVIRSLYLYVKGTRLVERRPEPVLAIFDRDSKTLKTQSDPFQYFNFQIKSPVQDLAGIPTPVNGQPVLITVDMWNSFISENPLESVVKGKYDRTIEEICRIFSKGENPVYIRWNPEMEVPARIYPWQGQSPVLYNQAFKRFSMLCRRFLPQAKIVWSTAGYPGVLEYFPGEDLVDYVGVTLQNASERSTKAYPGYKSVAAEIERKIHRMRFISKPVIIFGQPEHNAAALNSDLKAAAANIFRDQAIIYETISRTGIKENSFGRERALVSIGVYDPNNQLSRMPEISIEHLFPHWSNLRDGTFRKEFNEVIDRDHDVIVTMEPWRDIGGKNDLNVLENTIAGKYDEQLKELFSIISNVKQTVYLRWTHEMEIPINRYPWQSQPPVTYIKAFRHFASFRKPGVNNVKLVFGPTGDRGLQDWWPGDDVIDFISMAIYGLPDKNITDYRKQESFQTIFKRKSDRMRFFDKPLIISEFGIKGPEEFQLKWLLEASKTINSNPQIKAVCYFNMPDSPKAWGDIEAPDWTVSKQTFGTFIESLKVERVSRTLVSRGL